MSYSEENGQVVLRMTREDYDLLVQKLGFAAGFTFQPPEKIFELLNRLNEGNPDYTPYQAEAKKS